MYPSAGLKNGRHPGSLAREIAIHASYLWMQFLTFCALCA
jgi:hypothetical protein